MSKEVQRKMAYGAVWMLLFKLVERSLGLISMLILVRLLSPADFGIAAMAGSFILMAEMLTAFSFDVNLIQNQNATKEHYDTAWTCNVLLGLTITVSMLAGAPLIADFYRNAELFWVVCALAIGPLISGCENIGVVAFRKEMDFRREFAFQLSRKVAGFLVAVPVAYFTHSYWALVAAILVSKLAGTIISYLAHPFRPHFSLAKVAGLMVFSKWMLLNSFVSYLKERSVDLVTGRMLGAAALGLYNVTYEIAIMPTTELSAPINRALLPGFAKMAHDADAMRTAYRNAIGVLAFIAVPAATGIYALAPYIVPTLLGQKWLEGVPLMEILAFNGGLLLFHSSICTVLIANGHPDRVTKTNGLYVAVMLGLFALLIPTYGLTGAAAAALATSIVSTPVYLYQVRQSVGVPASVFLRAAARPVVAALLMAVAVRGVMPDWDPSMSFIISLTWTIGGIVLGIATYSVAILLFWLIAGRPPGPESELLRIVRNRLPKRAAPSPIP